MEAIRKVLLWACATFLGGQAYRMGGEYKTKIRDVGVPLIALALAYIIGIPLSWWWILAAVAMFGSLTTYCKFGNQEDVHWYNWWLTGALYGLAAFPICIATGRWLGFTIRTVFLAFAIMAWSEWFDDVEWEERGRGWLFVGTIPLLLI